MSHTHTRTQSRVPQFSGFEGPKLRKCWIGRVRCFMYLTSSVMQDIALRLTCLSSKTLQQQYKIQSNPVQMRPLTSKNKFTCTSWHQKTVSHMTAVFSSASRLPVLRKNKTVFHITAVLHITVVFAINCVVSFVWFLFEIRHAKQCWFHHAKTKIRLHIPL